MTRVHIELPAALPFVTELPVYIGHINYGGHLDNALLLTLVSEARLRFFQSLGYQELDVEGVGIVVADVTVQYRSEAFQGETMNIRMTAADFGTKGCGLYWIINDKTSGREVARGRTGIVFFDYATRKPVAVPAGFRNKF